MKFVRTTDLRSAEKDALAAMGDRAPETQLAWVREVAGAVADVLGDLLDAAGPRRSVIVVAGPGMNGADGIAAAIALHRAGYPCAVWSTSETGDPDGIRADLAAEALRIGLPFEHVSDWSVRARFVAGRRVAAIVDAVFGSGFHGEPRGNEAAALDFLRTAWPGVLHVAVDLPSGWDGDALPPPPFVPRADCTVVAGRPRPAMATPQGLDLCGRLQVAGFSIPADALAPFELPSVRENGVTDLTAAAEVADLFPCRRPGNAHKGDFGRLLLLGGCESYPGAITLCALGALRSGAGMVYVGTSATARSAIAARVPCAIPDDDLFAARNWEAYNAAVIGPGLGLSPEARRIVASALYGAGSPVVIDADAIAHLAGRPEALRSCGRPIVMTPHVAELSKVLGWPIDAINADRAGAARKAADLCGCVILLKGQGTLVAAPGDSRIWMNPTGNPGMACGGSGDVLAGFIGGLLAQGFSTVDAARAGAWIHGRAGDLCATRLTPVAMNAEDIAAAIPAAIASLHTLRR